ncbi:MAG: cell division protein FtsZ [Bacteroidaceae bacterium]|nr:cell division protein FtsZ [Bacteroidaceae bacterium]
MMKEEEFAPFNFPIVDMSEKIIKVIGVGGGGGNAVHHMWEAGVRNVTFMVVNTDSQVLKANMVPNKVQLGDGLGTGGNPELGREIAEASKDKIKSMFDADTKMVFITAGMGGGTGTGVAPVIARMAKELGILTVGVVTLPFLMEGKKRIDKALKGMEELKKHVDSLIVINNERLLEEDQYSGLDLEEGMKKADEVLTIATKTIAEIITVRGIVNRDFNDVSAVMKESGAAVVSVAKASGERRIFKAMESALNSPLIANVDKQKIKRLLYIVYGGTKSPAKMSELLEINKFMEGLDENIEVLWGHYQDETLEDEIKVSIIATGFDMDDEEEEKVQTDESEHNRKLRDKYYHFEKEEKETLKEVEQPLPASDENIATEEVKVEDEEDEPEEEIEEPKPSLIRIFMEKLKNFAEE